MADNEPPLPRWWSMFRRIVVFILGVIVILDALFEQSAASSSTVKLIVGLIMVGTLPIDDLLSYRVQRIQRRNGNKDENSQ